MTFTQTTKDFFFYPTKRVQLEEVEVPNEQIIGAPIVPINSKKGVRVRVQLVYDGYEKSELVRSPAGGQPPFIFNHNLEANMRRLIKAREGNWHNLLDVVNRSGTFIIKISGTGAFAGGLAGAGLAYACPQIGGPVLLVAAAKGAGLGTLMGAFTGGVIAWHYESATVKTIDYVINLNALFQVLTSGKLPTELGGRQLHELYALGRNMRHVGETLFWELYQSLEVWPDKEINGYLAHFKRLCDQQRHEQAEKATRNKDR